VSSLLSGVFSEESPEPGSADELSPLVESMSIASQASDFDNFDDLDDFEGLDGLGLLSSPFISSPTRFGNGLGARRAMVTDVMLCFVSSAFLVPTIRRGSIGAPAEASVWMSRLALRV
jgi:hypothetical protein